MIFNFNCNQSGMLSIDVLNKLQSHLGPDEGAGVIVYLSIYDFLRFYDTMCRKDNWAILITSQFIIFNIIRRGRSPVVNVVD